MLAFAWIVAQALAAPSPACTGPDISIAVVRRTLTKGKDGAQDRLIIYANVSNVGTADQTPGVHQHVELLHNGRKLVSEQVPALHAHEKFLVALRIFRDPNDRKEPLEVIVRYIPDNDRARAENCNPVNDSVQKIF